MKYFFTSTYLDDFNTPYEALIQLIEEVNQYQSLGWQSQGIKKRICTNTGFWKYTVELRYYPSPIVEIANQVLIHEQLLEDETKDCFWNRKPELRKITIRKAG